MFGHDIISQGLNVTYGLGATCKGLGCGVLSDLELDLLDAVVGSPVCYWEIKSFPFLKCMNSSVEMCKKNKVPGYGYCFLPFFEYLFY